MYPSDMNKTEFEEWVRKHPEDKKAFESAFTVIRRSASGGLSAIPYFNEYREFLEAAQMHMNAAAEISEDVCLKRFLSERAKALKSGDYTESDKAWLALDGKIDVTIGAYETYEDKLFGYKASFESMIGIVDKEATERAMAYAKHMDGVNRNLPISVTNRFTIAAQHPIIRVANLVFAGGSAKGALSFIAANLPNDKGFIEKYGSKKILFKNSMHAKFDALTKRSIPILISGEQAAYVNFEMFFNIVLAHEISHGLGPMHVLMSDGSALPVNERLMALHASLEEAKADVVGVYYLCQLHNQKAITLDKLGLFSTYLMHILRLMKIGLGEAHTDSAAMEYNFLREKGAILFDGPTSKFKVEINVFESAVNSLAGAILDIQASGDFEAAKRFVEKYCNLPVETDALRNAVKGLPLDVNLMFDSL